MSTSYAHQEYRCHGVGYPPMVRRRKSTLPPFLLVRYIQRMSKESSSREEGEVLLPRELGTAISLATRCRELDGMGFGDLLWTVFVH